MKSKYYPVCYVYIKYEDAYNSSGYIQRLRNYEVWRVLGAKSEIDALSRVREGNATYVQMVPARKYDEDVIIGWERV